MKQIIQLKMLDLLVIVLFFIVNVNCQVKPVLESSIDKVSYANPDQHGYRYCASWKMADDTPLHSICDPYNLKRCGETLKYKYQCCPGFAPEVTFGKNPQGKPVCGKVVPAWTKCSDVMDKLTISPGLSKELSSLDQNSDYTIIAANTGTETKGSGASSPTYYQVVKGRHYTADLQDNQELTSVFSGQKLLVSKYPSGIMCIDCVEISKSNMECKNGVIHTVRRSLLDGLPGNAKKTNIYDSMQSNSDISSFVKSIPADMKTKLKQVESGARFTVFAVKNSDWDAIQSKYSGKQLEQVVKNHIFPKMYCSAALSDSSNTLESSNKESVPVSCNVQDKKEVRKLTDPCGNEITVTKGDNIASNGVYHVVDKPIIPTAARSLKEIMENDKCKSSFFFQAQRFFNILKEGCDLRMKDGKKYAVIVPTDSAFEWFSKSKLFKKQYQKFLVDKKYRCQIARYHVVEANPEVLKSSTLSHEKKGYVTNNKKELFETNYFLKNKDNTKMYFHYSPIIDLKESKFKKGAMYKTSRVNVFADDYLINVLKKIPDTKEMHALSKKAKMNDTVFFPNRPLNLYLVVKDKGLQGKDNKLRKDIAKYNKKGLKNFLLLHTVPFYLWGDDIGYFRKNTVHKFKSRAGIELTFIVDDSGTMRIGHDGMPDKSKWPKVVKFNIPAIDGIIWLLDGTLKCPKKMCPHMDVVVHRDWYKVYGSGCRIKELPGLEKNPKLFSRQPLKIARKNTDHCVTFESPIFKSTKKKKKKHSG